jgi:hypothetical protein
MKPLGRKENGTAELVSDLISSETHSWNWEVLEANFFPIDVEIIKQIPLRNSEGADWTAWPSRSRECTQFGLHTEP